MQPHIHTRAFSPSLAIVSSIFLLTSSAVFALNLGFLRNTPISYMRQPDLQALNDAARVALDTKQDGESLNWNNNGTRNPVQINGTVTPHDTVKRSDQTCRKVTLVATAKGQTQSWTPTACRKGRGKWELQRQ
jgi:surface antigen